MAVVNGWMWGLGGVLGLAANFGGALAEQYGIYGMILAYGGFLTWLFAALTWGNDLSNANWADKNANYWWLSYLGFGGFSQYYAFDELDDLQNWVDMQTAAEPDYSCCPSWQPTCTC